MYIFCFYDDCTLISIYNYDKKALGILHTDWKGTLEDIINESVDILVERINSKLKGLIYVNRI